MTPQNGNPGAGNAGASTVGSPKQQNANKVTQPSPSINVFRAADGVTMTFTGREAQTLDLLIKCGAAGVTSGEASPMGWARRTSAYVLKLRQAGVSITTTRESASGATVGRYTLLDQFTVVASSGL